MRSLLRGMTPSNRASHSARIREHLRQALPPSGVGEGEGDGILAFLPFPTEPDLLPLLRSWQGAGRVVAVPRMVEDKIVPVDLPRDPSLLFPSPFPPPKGEENGEGVSIPPSRLSMVLAPGLAFTREGVRLGRGGGHFDRFLAASDLPSWGVCFSNQVLEEIPTDPWDIPMRVLVTENGMQPQTR